MTRPPLPDAYTKYNNIGFNNIPRKLQEDTSRVRGSISKEIISRHLATQPTSSKSKVAALLASRKNNPDNSSKRYLVCMY